MERNRYDRVIYRNLLAEMVIRSENYESLSRVCEIDAQTFGKKMRGDAPFTVFQVDKLCRYFNKPFEFLFATTE
jgi:hypothetical protein